MNALEFLAAKSAPVPPVCIVYGDEPFLKRQVLGELRHRALAGSDSEFSIDSFDGPTVEPREVFDCLSTVALFGDGKRLVIVEDADEFVSRNRSLLEAYVAKPRTSGVLVLEVGTWASNTRLYKALDKTGLQLECKVPAAAALMKWLGDWSKQRHGAKLERPAAELLVEIAGPELGLLDQELAKLASAVVPGGTINEQLVHDLVGGWRAKTTWDLIDAAASGDAREAMLQLERLLLSGENAVGLMAQIGWSLRRFAAATRLIEQAEAAGRRISLRQALEGAGVKSYPPFAMEKAEQQLRQIGRVRAATLYQWILEADLALKGSHSSPPRARTLLEQLIVRLSKAAQPTGSAPGRSPARVGRP